MKIILITNLIAFCVTVVATLYVIKRIRRYRKRKSQAHQSEHIGVKPVSASRNNTSNLQSVGTPVSSKTQEDKPVTTDSNKQPLTNEVQPAQKTLSKKEQRKIERKEERARKQEEIPQKREAEVEARRSFNPKTTKPSDVTYKELAVSEGRLVTCSIGQTPYYRSWEYEGRFFYEFFCEKTKAAKAVNNHSVIIDPFCQKGSASVSIEEAKRMTIIEFGEIDSNNSVISKSIILFE